MDRNYEVKDYEKEVKDCEVKDCEVKDYEKEVKDYEKEVVKEGVKQFKNLAKNKDKVCLRKLKIRVSNNTSRMLDIVKPMGGEYSIIKNIIKSHGVKKYDIESAFQYISALFYSKYDISMVSDKKTLKSCKRQINAEIKKYKRMYK